MTVSNCVLMSPLCVSIPAKGLFLECPCHPEGHYIYLNGKIILGKPITAPTESGMVSGGTASV